MSKVAVVTGGTRGIGEAISLALKDMGFAVAANYAGNDAKAQAFSEKTCIASFKWDVGDHQACLDGCAQVVEALGRSEEHTSELQSLMRISYAVFCLKKKKQKKQQK